jgi:hypothetical protein
MKVRAGRLLDFLGGSIGRMAGTGLVTGLFFVAFGLTPSAAVIWILQNPPEFISSGWFRIGLLLIGMAIIWASLNFNRWSRRQKVIDALAEDLSWAIHDLLNRDPRPGTEAEIAKWESDYEEWCKRVSTKLDNRAFFTRADQIHFDRLGFVRQVPIEAEPKMRWWLSQLSLKFDRLRDVINWSQQRGY